MMHEWGVELVARAVKTGFVVASSRKEAEEKVARGEWEAIDVAYEEKSKPRVTKREVG